MQELVNFSTYEVDLERFNHQWDEVKKFCATENLDGIELLLGDVHQKPDLPRGLVKTVHLPGWFGWTRTWTDPHSIPDTADPLEIAFYYGAKGPGTLLSTFCTRLNEAAGLHANYGVLHVSHVELDEVYTQKFKRSSQEILFAAASFVNAVAATYHKGEPPVPIAFENLWWPGLTFQSEEDVQYFTELLQFDNWLFLLDTGHLMNHLQVCNEAEGISKVISTLKGLSPETRERIRSVHLQCSTSGPYQHNHLYRSPPDGFASMPYPRKMTELMQHIPHIDEHRPFSDTGCREIIDLINPDYLVHEFITQSREELTGYIRMQKDTIS